MPLPRRTLLPRSLPLALLVSALGCGSSDVQAPPSVVPLPVAPLPVAPPAAPILVEQPNVVLISLDGLRYDRTHFGGNRRSTTPNLDVVAATGVNFPYAFSQSNESLLSHSALLTSRYASEVARPDYLTYTMPDEALLVGEALISVGYETAAFVAGGHIKASFGFDQGFDTFYEGEDFGSFQDTGAMASQWLEKRVGDQPFFLFLHGYDCHRPYVHTSVFYHPFDAGYLPLGLDALAAKRNFSEHVYKGVVYADFDFGRIWHDNGERMLDPAGYQQLPVYAAQAGSDALTYKLTQDDLGHLMAHYDGAVLEADTYVGLFLETLVEQGLWDDTIVIALADHGEDMQDHGFYNHRSVIFDSTTRVPFVLGGGAVPEAWRGSTHFDLVDAVDLVPTIMDVVGSVPPAGSRGRSVWALLQGEETPAKEFVFQQGVLGQSSARSLTHRLVFSGFPLTDEDYLHHLAADPIDGGSFALYHTARDRTEQDDILAEQPALAEEMRAEMVRWLASLEQGTAAETMSPEVRRMMQDRGYW